MTNVVYVNFAHKQIVDLCDLFEPIYKNYDDFIAFIEQNYDQVSTKYVIDYLNNVEYYKNIDPWLIEIAQSYYRYLKATSWD